MSEWYRNFQHTKLWSSIENAIRMLEKDGGLTCPKGRDPVIGFIHHQLDARGLVKPEGFERHDESQHD